jgi:hypothetical protein
MSKILFLPSILRRGFCVQMTLIASVILVSTCGSSSSSKKPIAQTQRTGRATTSVDAKYIDEAASVNSDGTKIVFTSGRDGGTPRVYKATFSGGAWSAAAKLSSNSGLTSENTARVSPDGSWVLIQGATASGQSLVICAFTTGTCATVATSPWATGQFEFTGNSALFYYITGTKSSGGSLFVGTAEATPTTSQVGASDTFIEAFWSVGASSPYSLVTARKSSTPGKKTLSTRSFTSPSTAATATATDFTTDVSYAAIIDHDSASNTLFAVAAPIKASTNSVFAELGTIDEASRISIPLSNELHTWTAAGSDQGAVGAAAGFETLSAWITSDNTTVFSLNRVVSRCAGDAGSTFGFSMALITLANKSVTWRHLKKPTDLSQAPTVSADPCDRAINGAATTYDFGVSSIKVNMAATAAANTVVWTSDMTGDPEVFASVTASGTTTVYNISGNRVP